MSAIIPTFARRPIFGYAAMVLSLIATAFLAFGLWVHHMFATNLPELGKSFFTAASMMIAGIAQLDLRITHTSTEMAAEFIA